jgi:hypothetical protein
VLCCILKRLLLLCTYISYLLKDVFTSLCSTLLYNHVQYYNYMYMYTHRLNICIHSGNWSVKQLHNGPSTHKFKQLKTLKVMLLHC